MTDGQWIFGYGSLVWRPGFAYVGRRPAFVRGYARRFWQASRDHRGTAERPGRVATLIEDPAALCWGMAYRVAAENLAPIVEALDRRERAGYERVAVRLRFSAAEDAFDALTYIAGPGNPNYLGPAPLLDIAAQVCMARGPSGTNAEYVIRLAQALVEMGAADDHTAELARLVVGTAAAQEPKR